MFIQGNLQIVFEALYSVGAIDPVLDLDWNKITSEMEQDMENVYQAFRVVNSCHNDVNRLILEMRKMNPKYLNYLAMEVAREFCEYQDRSTIH